MTMVNTARGSQGLKIQLLASFHESTMSKCFDLITCYSKLDKKSGIKDSKNPEEVLLQIMDEMGLTTNLNLNNLSNE